MTHTRSPSPTVDRKAVRAALRLWHRTSGLGDFPLAHLPLVEARRLAAGYRDAAVGRGLALRDVLRLALDELRPQHGEPDPGDVRWRAFVILNEQYLAGRKPDYLAEMLSVARSTLDHEQAAALDRVADILREWNDHPPQELAPAAPPSAVPQMAPPPHPKGLVGRADLIEALRARLVGSRGDVALHGLPGVGKSALAVELAHDREVRSAFPDGVLWVGIGQHPDPMGLLALLGAAIGLSPAEFSMITSVEDRARLLHTLLAPRRALLVVDDVWDPAGGLLFRLGGEGCARLYTCRSGAVAAALAPEAAVRVPELRSEDGMDLLQRSLGAAGPLEEDQARRLVSAVGAHPLALVLMGRTIGREGRDGQRRRRDAALAGLAQAERRLTIEEARSPLDQQPSLSQQTPLSLEVVLGLSDESLSEAARRGLRRLGFLPPRPATFGEQVALSVVEEPVTGRSEKVLDDLVDSGLVEPAGESRYSLHPVVSDYARARSDSGARRDFAGGVLRLAVDHGPDRTWLAAESEGILAALDAAQAEGLQADYLRGVLAVSPALEAEGRSKTALQLLEHAEVIARGGADPADLVHLLALRARAHQHLGDYAQAEAAAREALDTARQIELTTPQPELLLALGAAAASRGDVSAAEARFEEGLHMAEAARSPGLMAAFEANLASLALSRGQSEQAEARLRLALRLAQAAGDRVREASVLINLGALLAQSKRFDDADVKLQEAAELARLVGTREQRVFVLTNLGALANDRGHPAAAEGHFAEALDIARGLGDPAPMARLLANLGALAAARADFQAAESMYTEGLELARVSGHEANVRLLEHNVRELEKVRGK